MKPSTLTLALAAVAMAPAVFAAESRDGMHRMPDGSWMANHAMTAREVSPAALSGVDVPAARTIVATVNGLVCDFCAQSVRKTLLKEPGVGDATVDLTAKTVTVSLSKGGSLGRDRLAALLKDAGYDLTGYREE